MISVPKYQNMIDSFRWAVRDSSPVKEGAMPDHIIKRKDKKGKEFKNFYASRKYKGVFLRDCLETTDILIAQKRLIELELKVDRNEYHAWKKTFSNCVDEWKSSLNMTRGNHQRYESIARIHLIPRFANSRVVDLVTHDQQTGKSVLSEYLEEISGMPQESVKKFRVALSQILKHYDKSFKLPKANYANPGFYQTRFLTIEELNIVVDNLSPGRHKLVASLMAYTGLDLTEALFIKWGSINLKRNFITMKRDKRLYSSEALTREIPLTDACQKLLRSRFKIRKLHDDRVFDISYAAFQKAWNRARERWEIEWNVRIKDLRHFFGSHMLNSGVDPMLVANLMGHSSVNMLLKRYGHYRLDTKQKAIDVFNESMAAR